MARAAQVRGMLLEEAVLFLLRQSGYLTVETAAGDSTLRQRSSGLEVQGRGEWHQIDAVADFRISQPFSYPQRLLVEAKCYSPKYPVGLPVVRNAVGVLKDVGEHWEVKKKRIARRRYHYQYAIFSATGYSANAERYAYAQDIYLIPLAGSAFFRPVIQAIRSVSTATVDGIPSGNVPVVIGDLRQAVRRRLRGQEQDFAPMRETWDAWAGIDDFIDSCRRMRFALLATLGGRFPVFLVPNTEIDVSKHLPAPSQSIEVRIRYDATEWYLESPDGLQLFSFELPRELFLLYAEDGLLTPDRALDLKAEAMSEIQAISTRGEAPQVMLFRLDHEWLASVKEGLEGRQ